MYMDKKVVVVMPAYNAAKTLQETHREVMQQGIVDEVILVDDGSRDDTVSIARTLPRTIVHVHDANRGYGGNQKSCYRLALEHGADIIIMVHPDGWRTVYGHLGSATVDYGAEVRMGHQIGTVGTTAGDGRPSIHFETRQMQGGDPVAIDPVSLLPR